MKVVVLLVLAIPAFEGVLCWIVQLSKGCCNPLSPFYIQLNWAKALWVRIHGLIPSILVQLFVRTSFICIRGSFLFRC